MKHIFLILLLSGNGLYVVLWIVLHLVVWYNENVWVFWWMFLIFILICSLLRISSALLPHLKISCMNGVEVFVLNNFHGVVSLRPVWCTFVSSDTFPRVIFRLLMNEYRSKIFHLLMKWNVLCVLVLRFE